MAYLRVRVTKSLKPLLHQMDLVHFWLPAMASN